MVAQYLVPLSLPERYLLEYRIKEFYHTTDGFLDSIKPTNIFGIHCFCWLPRHEGIFGNTLANFAALNKSVTPLLILYYDHKTVNRSYIRYKCKRSWTPKKTLINYMQ